MTDIEIKCKELETAKRIREMGSDGFVAVCDGIACDEDNCPFVVLCSDSKGSEVTPDYVRGFTASREAELAALDKAQESLRGDGNAGPSDGLSHVQTAPMVGGYVKIGEIHGAVGKAFGVYDRPGIGFIPEPKATPSPTIDDFVLALIQGGFALSQPGYDYGESFKALFSLAESLKAESDRRRGI